MPRKKRSPSPIVFDDFDYDCEDELSSNESKGNSNPPIQRNAANARERARMRVLSSAFCRLKTKLPWVPADTKLSKLDTLRLATIYIQQLRANLMSSDQENHQYLTDTSTAAPSLVWPFTFASVADNNRISTTNSTGMTQWRGATTTTTRVTVSNNDRQQFSRIASVNNSTAHG